MEPDDKLCAFDLSKTHVDLSLIKNRRFMYHPNGLLILGDENVASCTKKGLAKSHAVEYAEASALSRELPPFDDFVRGWIGVGRSYKDGIIHFAPHIVTQNIDLFEKAFSFIETALQNGFSPRTVLRGFPGAWEQTVNDVFLARKSSLDYQIFAAKQNSAAAAQKAPVGEISTRDEQIR